MKVLVACEFSGVVREAFAKLGHDAWSCDILPTEKPGQHYQGDVRDLLVNPDNRDIDTWDLIIAHPPCKYLANSGVRWLHTEPGRVMRMEMAADFFNLFLYHPCKRIAVENPVLHKYAIERIGRKQDQTIQPWQFGHGESKRTCLWLKGLPLLQPTNIVEGREQRIWKMPPSPDRGKNRSRTYPGIAAAMAEQWGKENR